MAKADTKITGSIDVLVDYKKGGLTLAQAVDRFRKLTGLTPDIAEKFIKGLGRDNVISLEAKRNIYASKSETADDRAR
jgi:hypothetical protein